jgi:hypothetical protein
MPVDEADIGSDWEDDEDEDHEDDQNGPVNHFAVGLDEHDLLQDVALSRKAAKEIIKAVLVNFNDIIDKTIEELLAHVIEPSSSATSYPVVLIRQGSQWRMCVDYRTLNDATVDDRYPLPRIDDIFESLSKGRVFSSVDAISGYHQLDLEPSDKWKTREVCPGYRRCEDGEGGRDSEISLGCER